MAGNLEHSVHARPAHGIIHRNGMPQMRHRQWYLVTGIYETPQQPGCRHMAASSTSSTAFTANQNQSGDTDTRDTSGELCMTLQPGLAASAETVGDRSPTRRVTSVHTLCYAYGFRPISRLANPLLVYLLVADERC